jgi:hypothetical protein
VPGRSAFKSFPVMRIVGRPAEIDQCTAANSGLIARLAPDEALLAVGGVLPPWFDEHAIFEPDVSFSAAVMSDDYVDRVLQPSLEWTWSRTATGQGVLHQVPIKVVRVVDQNLLLCPTAFAHELEVRLP